MNAQRLSTWKMSGPIAEARKLLQGWPHARVAVTGRPGIGKSIATHGLGFTSTDTFLGQSWESQKQRVILAGLAPTWRLEGVTVARALRHGLAPDALLWMRGTPLRSKMTLAAIRLGDSVDKWVQEALPSLVAAGCHVIEWQIKETKYA